MLLWKVDKIIIILLIVIDKVFPAKLQSNSILIIVQPFLCRNEVNDLTLCYKVAPILRAQYTQANVVPQHSTPSTASTGQHWYILNQNLQILRALCVLLLIAFVGNAILGGEKGLIKGFLS